MQGYCESLDQIANLEFKRAGTRQGGTALRYRAARAAQGDEALCGRVARALGEALAPGGGSVVLVTGTGNPAWLPHGETDGPSGVAVLARTFGALGLRSCVLAEDIYADAVGRSLLAAGAPLLDEAGWSERGNAALLLGYPAGAAAGHAFAESFFDRHADARAVIFVEKPGPNARGVFHNSSGKPKDPDLVAHAQLLAAAARRRGIVTVGVGDGGNEIGFGRAAAALGAHAPYGSGCGCPCGGGILDATEVDHLLPASVSNWGAYAIAAALCLHAGRHDAMPGWREVEASIAAPIAAGAYDGYTGLALPSVDGVSPEANRAVYSLMLEVLRMARTQA
ncbi:DUF4392 domain-containing protein [Pigmentiphaga soli]|uniref:DUF4392 domain-containing protein n=1 Tax=Pigmentiphaga soli TaxID=1007095 RepID=A0ABP8GH15_9BURK